jgi:tRNA modification GTPase
MSFMNENDTICGIATAMTNAGISIIRISGPNAIDAADQIYHGKVKLKDVDSHTVHYGHIRKEDEIIDEVMVLVMRGPRTYTREDTVEIDCHGGVYVTRQILNAVVSCGVRVAEPGEFTKRAFLNGRIDLSQAESVMDVITSQNKLALQNSIRQLSGGFSDKIKDFREKILYEVSFIEAALDDPEHYSLEGYYDELYPKIKDIYEKTLYYEKSWENGSLIKEGIQTAIVGKPNAGKSSLLNLLAKKDRAIVTEIPGTTRDILEEKISLQGIILRLLDTAGIRDTNDVIEQMGVNKSYDSMEVADLILYVIDASVPLSEDDRSIMERIKDKKKIVLLNKSDLEQVVNENEIKSCFSCPVISFSAKNGEGVKALEDCITEMFFSEELKDHNEIFLTNARQANAITAAEKSLFYALQSIENQMPEDFISIDLMDAYKQLGYIIGEEVEDDLVNKIFAEFCTGK